jgi:hypothetical protein
MSDESVNRPELDRVLDEVRAAERRTTKSLDVGFTQLNTKVDEVSRRMGATEVLVAGFHARLTLVERVVYAGLALVLSGVALAVLNLALNGKP